MLLSFFLFVGLKLGEFKPRNEFDVGRKIGLKGVTALKEKFRI